MRFYRSESILTVFPLKNRFQLKINLEQCIFATDGFSITSIYQVKIQKRIIRGPANGRSASIHPNDGVVERATSGFAPNKSGFSLISETDGPESLVDVEPIGGGLVDGFGHAHLHALQNLHGVVLHPPRLRVELRELHVVASDGLTRLVVDYEPAAARTLVDGANEHILRRHRFRRSYCCFSTQNNTPALPLPNKSSASVSVRFN